jgi:hypothetical protein
MFKISSVETESQLGFALNVVSLISGLKFSINVGKANSKQITSDIDERISRRLKEKYQPISGKEELSVYAESSHIGAVDLAFSDNENGVIAYIEIEKTDKKTLWFDYVKLVSKIGNDPSRIGIVICPKNYAHRRGTWDLYQEALVYRNHLARLSHSNSFNRIAVIGYLQLAYIDKEWKEFSPEVIKRLKDLLCRT